MTPTFARCQRPDHTARASRIMTALRSMADPNGLVQAPVAAIADAADVPVTSASQTLGVLRAKRLIERLRDGRGANRGGSLYRVLV